ncbi:MAG: hypothetical protein M0Z72_03875 [Deltaproteobacteria bacterium]|nr:hypothetical protein [Deltaproteobacteria bacterium]
MNTKSGQPRHPARQEQNPAQKFSFPFRRKKSAWANQNCEENFFCGVARLPTLIFRNVIFGGERRIAFPSESLKPCELPLAGYRPYRGFSSLVKLQLNSPVKLRLFSPALELI